MARYIKNTGIDWTVNVKCKRTIQLGWMHFEEKSHKYLSVRLQKDGTRQEYFNNDATG